MLSSHSINIYIVKKSSTIMIIVTLEREVYALQNAQSSFSRWFNKEDKGNFKCEIWELSNKIFNLEQQVKWFYNCIIGICDTE